MIKRILVALSGTSFMNSAIDYAVELAHRHDAQIVGLAVTDVSRLQNVGPVPVGGSSAARSIAERRMQEVLHHEQESMDYFRSVCERSGIHHRVHQVEGDAIEQFISLWRYNDLCIIGMHGLFEYGVLREHGDEVLNLVAHGIRPILAVGEEFRPVKRAFIAYDGSIEAAKAMKRFVQMRPWGKPLLRISCFGMPESESDPLLIDATEYVRAHGYECETEAVQEHPRGQISRHAAEWKADLIVMGASPRGKLARLIKGDSALEALHQTGIPLFLSQ